MRRISTLVFVLLGVLASVAGADFSGQVVGVVDGDSLRVMHNERAEQVRLKGIDCPERGQAFGQRAKQATSDLAFGQKVRVQSTGKDRYGRTLGTVGLPDGKNLNYELVRQGWCWWYRKYAPSDTELEALEQAARKARIGLWVDPAPIPPWEFRKTQRKPVPKTPRLDSQRAQDSLKDPADRASGQTFSGIIGNQQSRRYHRPDCPNYGQIAVTNRVEFTSVAEAEQAGYRVAGNCP